MSYVEYEKAQKLGLKAFKTAVSKGESEYLPVLDEILADVDIAGEISLGLVQVPLDRVVGTSTQGRTYAFANNFMPILDYKTEFGAKWSDLCDSQIEEGIRDPIKVYEYMNYFYVVEGNKRVSVMKYFEAVTIPAMVTRKIPKLSDDPQVKLYYEFMDFYKVTEINYLWFSQEGCFKHFLELTSDDPTAPWTDEQKQDFGSFNHRFCVALKQKGGEKLPMSFGDALLIFLDICGYDEVKNLTEAELKEKIGNLWDEFLIDSEGKELTLRMEPAKTGRKKMMEYFLPSASKVITVGFIYDKNPKDSDWLYAHELGRLYLEEHHSDTIKTLESHDLRNEDEIMAAIDGQVIAGATIIFTTSSRMESVSLKAAAKYPEITVLNCSIKTPHKLIRTYYARLHEVKFLSGMIAGSLSRSGRIGYLADYPIIGMPANINAFALGARMMNPSVKVYLEWTKIKGASRSKALENFRKNDVHYISDQDMIKPSDEGRRFGLYNLEDENLTNIAMPLYQWGIFYEKLIEAIRTGTYKEDETKEGAPVNYWWGLSAGVVDLIMSQKLPGGTKLIVDTIRNLMVEGKFHPFTTAFCSQDGLIRNDDGFEMSPEEILNMNYLVDNVEGEIPEIDELYDEAKAIVSLKGVDNENSSAG